SWWWAAWPRARATAPRRWASEGRRAQAPARHWGPAGAAQRAATPARVAWEALVLPLSGTGDGRWGWWPWANRAARGRLQGGGAVKGRGALWAWPPWLGGLERAGARTQARPAAAPRAARPSQGQRQATAPTRASREGAIALSKGAGAACRWRWSPPAPAWLT